jgi:HSP20 family protein
MKLVINLLKKEDHMSLMKKNNSMFNHLPSIFDGFFNDGFNWNLTNFSETNTTIPAINIKETKENYEVELAAPGMTKNDFQVNLDGNLLTITSEKSVNKESDPNVRYATREFSYESFQRAFTLQKDVVDADKIEARYEDGVLHLLIPKKEEAKQKQPRMIQIA